MYTVNKIAVQPFPDNSVKSETHGEGQFKVSKIANTKNTLVRLKVLADADRPFGNTLQTVPKGSFVWVRASEYATPWGKEIFKEGLEEPYILIAFERVELFEFVE